MNAINATGSTKKTTKKQTNVQTQKSTNLADSVSNSINKTQKQVNSKTNKETTSKNTSTNKNSSNGAKNSYTNAYKNTLDKKTKKKTYTFDDGNANLPNQVNNEVDNPNLPSQIKQTKLTNNEYKAKLEEQKAQKEARDTFNNSTRADFNSDQEYEDYALDYLYNKKGGTFSGSSATSKGWRDYLNAKGQENGDPNGSSYYNTISTKYRNKQQTLANEQRYRNGEYNDKEMERVNQYQVGFNPDGSVYTGSEYNTYVQEKANLEQKQKELEGLWAYSQSNVVETDNPNLSGGTDTSQTQKITYKEYLKQKSELDKEAKALEDYYQKNNLGSISWKSGFDYYDWANENGYDTSDFEATAQAMDDTALERITNDVIANGVDLVNTPIQVYDMAKSLIDDDFKITDEKNLSTQLNNYSSQLKTYVFTGTSGVGNIALKSMDSLMPMALSALTFNVIGGALGATGKALEKGVNLATNATLGLQNAGQVTRQRVQEGNDNTSAVINGILHGAITGIVEGLDAGKVTNLITGGAESILLSRGLFEKANFDLILSYLNSAGISEGAEEVIEDLADFGADNLQNYLMRKISGQSLEEFNNSTSAITIEDLNVNSMAEEFCLAYLGALIFGAKSANNVTIQSKQMYNCAVETVEYINDQIANNKNLSSADIELLQKGKQKLINEMGNYKDKASPINDGVQLPSDNVGKIRSDTEVNANFVQASRLDIKDYVSATATKLQAQEMIEANFKQALESRGISMVDDNGNEDYTQYADLSEEAKENVRKGAQYASDLGINVAFNSNMDINQSGVNIDGNIVINPNSNTAIEAILSHEITHNFESDTNAYNKLKDLIKGTQDYQNVLNDTQELYKGIETDIESEAIAKYIENNIANENFIEGVIKYDNSLANRIYTSVQSLLTSNTKTKIENAWKEAFRNVQKEIKTGLEEKYSINKNLETSLKDLYEKTTTKNGEDIVVGTTSKFLADVLHAPENIQELPVLMDSGKAYQAMATESKAKQDGVYKDKTSYHGLGYEGLYNALVKSEDPVYVFVSKNIQDGSTSKNRITLVTDETDYKGFPVIVAFEFNSNGFIEKVIEGDGDEKTIQANKNITAFGIKKISNKINEAINDGRILYANKEKSQSSSLFEGVLLPDKVQEIDFDNNIQKFWDNFKPQREIKNKKYSLNNDNQKHKEAQNNIIQETNPRDTTLGNHTWIDSAEDIQTFQEAINDLKEDSEKYGYENLEMSPDFQETDINKALETGKITVYSSYEIKNGTWVTPSKMEAEAYGGGKAYSKEVNVDDVAWLKGANGFEGMYANTNLNNETQVENKNVSKKKTLEDLKHTILNYSQEEIDGSVDSAFNQETNEVGVILNEQNNTQIPENTKYGKTRRTIKTLGESNWISNEDAQQIKKDVLSGKYSYIQKPNKVTLDEAIENLKTNGYAQTAKNFLNEWDSRNMATSDVDGMLVLNELSRRGLGNSDLAGKIKEKLAYSGTVLGRGSQVRAMLKSMSPELQIQAMWAQVQDINEELNEKYGEGSYDLKLDEDLVDEYVDEDTTEERREEIVKELVRDVNKQIPRSVGEVLNSWRHFAMLSNFRTGVKNFVSNIATTLVQWYRRNIEAGIESIMAKKYEQKGESIDRYAGTFNPLKKADRTSYNFWGKYYLDNFKNFQGKYNHTEIGDILFKNEFGKKISEERNVWGEGKTLPSKVINAYQNFENWMLQDTPAMKSNFGIAMTGYLKANNIDINEHIDEKGQLIVDEKIQKGIDYAFEQAKYNTLNNNNKFASALVEFEKNTGKVGEVIVESFMAYKKVPSNEFAMGARLSPFRVIYSVYEYATKLQKGTITPNQFCEGLASGLAGTSVVALGALLAGLGLLRADGGDDDDPQRKKNFDEDHLAKQDFSITLPNGATYTIDWMGPAVAELMFGAKLVESNFFDGEEDVVNTLADVGTSFLDVFFENTFMSGMQYNLTSYGDEWYSDLGAKIAQNYIMQYFPSVIGAFSKAIDGTERRVSPNEGSIDKLKKMILNKTPFRFVNEPDITTSGEEEKMEDLGAGFFGRLFLKTFSPGDYKESDIDKYDEELYSLYDKTGVADVFPSNFSKNTQYDSEKYKFTDKEYTQFNQTRLATEDTYVNQFIDSDFYNSYDDSEKVQIIKGLREYALDVAKDEYLASKGITYEDSTYERIKQYFDLDITDEQKMAIFVANKVIDNKKDENGDTITNSKSYAIADAYADAGVLEDVFDYIEKNGLDSTDFGINKSVYKKSIKKIAENYEEIYGEEFGTGYSDAYAKAMSGK